MDLGITDQTTKNGRPIDELNADYEAIAKAKKAGIGFAESVCDFADSRRGISMNSDALRDIAARWKSTLAGLAWIHRGYAGPSSAAVVTASEAIVLCSIGLVMPAYCFTRRENRAGAYSDLPDIVGDIYKTMNGMHAAAIEIAMRSSLHHPVRPDDFYTYSDQGGLFRGPADRVCPAPRKMIHEAVEALLFGRCAGPQRSELEQYIPDFHELQTYAAQFFGPRGDAVRPAAVR